MKYSKFSERVREHGFRGTLQLIARKIIGIDLKKMQDEIDTLRFFLNQYHKPSDLKVTSDPYARM